MRGEGGRERGGGGVEEMRWGIKDEVYWGRDRGWGRGMYVDAG